MSESNTGKATPSPDEEPSRPRKKRRWLRRLLFLTGSFLGLLFLLLLLLPTIINLLPVERWASSSASDFFTGKLTIEKMKVGWTRTLRIERLVLRDPAREKGELFLEAKDIHVSRSLLQMAFSEDRLGTISIGSLNTNIVRTEDGEFNFASYIPEAPEEAKPEEPFVLDLKTLVPEMPVPISELHFLVNDLNLSYQDFATSPNLDVAFAGKQLRLDWK